MNEKEPLLSGGRGLYSVYKTSLPASQCSQIAYFRCQLNTIYVLQMVTGKPVTKARSERLNVQSIFEESQGYFDKVQFLL